MKINQKLSLVIISQVLFLSCKTTSGGISNIKDIDHSLRPLEPGKYACLSNGSTAYDISFGEMAQLELTASSATIASDTFNAVSSNGMQGQLNDGQVVFTGFHGIPQEQKSPSIAIDRHEYDGIDIITMKIKIADHFENEFDCEKGLLKQDPPSIAPEKLSNLVSITDVTGVKNLLQGLIDRFDSDWGVKIYSMDGCHINKLFPAEALCYANVQSEVDPRTQGDIRVRLGVENDKATTLIDYQSDISDN